jgi:hypothetical protein
MLLATIANAPSCQWSPRMKKSSAATNEPDHAKVAMCRRLCPERSTKAPTTGSTKALLMVAKLIR